MQRDYEKGHSWFYHSSRQEFNPAEQKRGQADLLDSFIDQRCEESTRFTCNPTQLDAEKEQIKRGYRNYLPLHHEFHEIDAANRKR